MNSIIYNFKYTKQTNLIFTCAPILHFKIKKNIYIYMLAVNKNVPIVNRVKN